MTNSLLPFTLFLLLLIPAIAQPQRESFDVFTFTAPSGFRKQTTKSSLVFSQADSRRASWCQIALYSGTPGTGTPESDFEHEWKTLALPLSPNSSPTVTPVSTRGEWKIRATTAGFSFEGKPAIVMVTTFSSLPRSASILATFNSQDCLTHLEPLIRSLELRSPASSSSPPADPQPLPANPQPPSANPAPSAPFSFTNTKFDDGWSGSAFAAWTEVAKNNLKVLIHYPLPQADAYNSVLRDADLNAWNLLVAPRYTNIRNFQWRSIQSFESITFLQADANDKSSGAPVHIVLFKKHYSNGNGRYLEFIAPSRAAYEAEFGPYHNDEFNWDRNANFQSRNKFAVSPSDLSGTWSASDYASLAYYYVSSGRFAGATATSTADSFTFFPGNSYQSDHTGASGAVGSQRWSRQVYKGTFTIRDWTITLTNRFQGAAETFNCQFEAIRGGRILLLTDRNGTTHSLIRQK